VKGYRQLPALAAALRKRRARRRLPEGLAGIGQLHGLVGEHADDPAEVGIETDRGLWVAALVAAGYEVYAINPKAVSRYRDRYGGGSGAKSDAGDAKVLADLVRTDRHNHRPVAGDSELAEAIKVLARAHQRQPSSTQRCAPNSSNHRPCSPTRSALRWQPASPCWPR
jgi:transposase